MRTPLDTLTSVADQMTAQLVDVPLWISGIDVVKDMRAIAAAYTSAADQLGTAVAGRDQARIDSAMVELKAARLVSPALGDHIRTARLAGLNC
jgi:hypothetical protein